MKYVIIAAVFVFSAAVSSAAIWHVAKDGSGDFTAIQDAVDAAAPGDVIQIHAGRYDEMTEDYDPYENGSVVLDCHVAIETDDLTLRGDGADVTIVGPETYPSDPVDNYMGLVVLEEFAERLTIEDLAIENVRYGVFANCPSLNMLECRFEGNRADGFYVYTSTSCIIEGCEFVSCFEGGVTWAPSANVSVVGCAFRECPLGLLFAGTANLQVSSSEFDCELHCVSIQQGSYGTVADCSMLARGEYGYGVSLSLGGNAEINDCQISGGNRGIIVGQDSSVFCQNVELSSQTLAAVLVNTSGQVALHDCSILNGGGWSVKCNYVDPPECHLDMTNNYWGTDSEEQIAEWIYDSNDDPDYCCTVDFIPFNGSMSTEPQSWSAVKGLFLRGDEE